MESNESMRSVKWRTPSWYFANAVKYSDNGHRIDVTADIESVDRPSWLPTLLAVMSFQDPVCR
jgi:hypothetical protein